MFFSESVPDASLVDRQLLLAPDNASYFATAGEGLVPCSAIEATSGYYKHKIDPVGGREQITGVTEEVRARTAGLLGADAQDIAFLSNASHALAAVFNLVNWETGDNVVLLTNELEFPSLVLPPVKLVRNLGVEMRVVDHDNWRVTPEMIANAVDDRTRIVVLSHVSYRTGLRIDIERLSTLLDGSNAWLVVDASQSLGVIPTPTAACHFLVSTSCKWLLGPHGVGILYWNRDKVPDIEPADIGWYSVVDDLAFPYELKPGAERFEVGSPAWPAIYGLGEGLKLIDGFGIDRIEDHVSKLATYLLDALPGDRFPVITPTEPGLRAGIVSWLDDDPPATAKSLADHGIFVTGSSGRIRVSIHLYNAKRDIDRLIEVLAI